MVQSAGERMCEFYWKAMVLAWELFRSMETRALFIILGEPGNVVIAGCLHTDR